MSKLFRVMLAGVACASIAACTDQLEVLNPNNADQDRALARPSDVEALISGSYNTMWRGTMGATTLNPQMYVLGMENYSGLANFVMGVRAAIPRPPINNDRGNAVATENFAPFLALHRASRAAAMGLSRVTRTDFTFFPPSATQTARAKAFANFVIGVSLGQVALAYDSGSAISEADDLTSNAPLPFMNYDALAAYAIQRLDSAHAAAPNMAVPAAWIGSSGDLTQAQFRGLISGWRARIRAGVARNPSERGPGGIVDWPAVLTDANAFMAAFANDYVMALVPSQGWDYTWLASMYASNSVNWHMMWGYIAHMAAEQTQYEAWLATAPDARQPFVMISADQRWPQGATRLAQQCWSGALTGATCTGNPVAPAGNFGYVENRANDWTGDPSASSQYRHKRFLALNNASPSRTGPMPAMTTAEMRLLAAEAQYHAGNFAAAAALVDVTRIARGVLPGLVANGVVNNSTLVPGGANCVPRIPTLPLFRTTACGNLWEALKYEKRMETQFTTWVGWYADSRGWGDVPAATPPHWPVPYQEMDARLQAFYPSAGTAPVGTYGL